MSSSIEYTGGGIATGNADPSLALNAGGLVNYGAQLPFLDIGRTMGQWIGSTSSTMRAMTADELKDAGYLDKNGYVTAVPEDLLQVSVIWQWGSLSEEVKAEREGVYVMRWDGEAKFALNNVVILSEEPGQITFRWNGDRNFNLSIQETDPAGTGDYMRNISIVKAEHLELFEAGAVFDPDWIDFIKDVRELRFMGWQETNNSTAFDWADRPTLDSADWSQSNGVPVEIMVRLANEAGIDPWFNMPHLANQEYIREFATYVRDNLDPGLVASVEFSNETWNWGFSQIADIRELATEAWGDAGKGIGITHYTAKLATEMAQIWKDVFGEDAETRLSTVLGTQTYNPGLTSALLNPTRWFALEPDVAVNPSSVFDAIAVTTYFGHAVLNNDAQRQELITVLAEQGEENTYAYLADKLMDPEYDSSIPHTIQYLIAQNAIADAHGLNMVAYEGGQHVHHLAFLRGAAHEEAVVLSDFLGRFVQSHEMADLYQELWDSWAEISDGPFMQFGSISASGRYGTWAAWEYLTDVSPRGEVLKQLNENYGSWWGDGSANSAYLQGVTIKGADTDEVIIGTNAEDYLIGGAGNDTIAGGGGDDGINGGSGYDVLVLSGSASDYHSVAENAGWRLNGPDGSDFVVDVEGVLFENGETMSFEDFVAVTSKQQAANEPVIIDGSVERDRRDMLGRADLAEIEDRHAFAGDTDGTGVTVLAVQAGSLIDQDLAGWSRGDESVYVIASRSTGQMVDGMSVNPSYHVLLQNAFDAKGISISASAFDTTSAIAAIVRNVDGVSGTAFNDFFEGRSGQDVFYGLDGDDTLRGGSGDDVLSGGTGTNRMNGGEGYDTVLLAGSAADYNYAENGEWLLITGKESKDYAHGIEAFVFDTGEVLTREDLLAPAGHSSKTASLGLVNLITLVDGIANAADPTKGLLIYAAQAGSELTSGLTGWENTPIESVYMIASRSDIISVNGIDVSANYHSLQTNTATKGGLKLSNSLYETVSQIAAIVRDVDGIAGSDQSDLFEGRGSDDIFFGMGGADVLRGNTGDDILDGGGGNDRLTGGAGMDTFVYTSGRDIIWDFTTDEDRLDLTGLHLEDGIKLANYAELDQSGNLQLTFSDVDKLTLAFLNLEDLEAIDVLF